MTPDTNVEAVERLARLCEEANGFALFDVSNDLAATLRALLAERDAAQARCDLFDTQAAAAKIERDRLAAEVASLRLTLGGRTFDASVPEPIGCPLPGACSTVAEIVRGREMQAAWLHVIQAENTCGVTGKPCDAVRCGCAAEQEMLIREAREGQDNG